MNFFSSKSQWIFVGISRNDKELKDLDESDRKSTVFSGNLRNFREISENFDGLFDFPIKICIWSRRIAAIDSARC